MTGQLRLFQVSGHRDHIDSVGMAVADVIGNDNNRASARLHAGIWVRAEVRKPDIAALRCAVGKNICRVMHRRRDILPRIKAEPSVVFCFHAVVFTSHRNSPP